MSYLIGGNDQQWHVVDWPGSEMTKNTFWPPMQFVRQKIEILITWSIFTQIEKLTPQNRKSQRAWFNGQRPKLQKNTHFEPKNGFSGVTKFFENTKTLSPYL